MLYVGQLARMWSESWVYEFKMC